MPQWIVARAGVKAPGAMELEMTAHMTLAFWHEGATTTVLDQQCGQLHRGISLPGTTTMTMQLWQRRSSMCRGTPPHVDVL